LQRNIYGKEESESSEDEINAQEKNSVVFQQLETKMVNSLEFSP
jgi:hypothetical protein